MNPDADVVIVGAGIAGLTAARCLVDAGFGVRVFEARPRPGGRIHTDREFAAEPVECGAEFIHGHRGRIWHYLNRFGLQTQPALGTRGSRFVDGNRLRHPLWLLTRPAALRLFVAVSALLRHRGSDQSVADFLQARGITGGLGWRLAQAQANAACTSLEDFGVVDAIAALSAPQSRGGNFRLIGGYQMLVESMRSGLDVCCGEPVTVVRWSEAGVEIATKAGRSVRARAAIITLPLGVLQAEVVRFEPALPDAKRRAIAALTMHPAVKLLFRFRHLVGDPRVRVITGDGEVPAFWRAPDPTPVWTAFVTGPHAPAIAAAPERVAARLCVMLDPDALHALDTVEVVDWGSDLWSRGGYSAAPPGTFPARAILAEKFGRIVFAGEATATNGEAGTVSGALETGERAASEVQTLLGEPGNGNNYHPKNHE